MSDMLIRPAMAEDWAGIWPFLRSIVAAGETYTWPRDVDEARARGMWMVPPPGGVLVAVDAAGRVLGSAKVTPNQLGPGAHVANGSFMVDHDAGRKGVGRALGEAALDLARQRGFRAMQFNAVVETNVRAVALWQSLGFAIIGTVPEAFDHPAHGPVGLHVMHRML